MFTPQKSPPKFVNNRLIGDSNTDLTELFERKDLPGKIIFTSNNNIPVIVIVNL